MIAWRPESFLYVLNGFLLDESGESQRKTPQEQMEGGPSFRFSPKKKIDLVLHAPCPLEPDQRCTMQFPMGYDYSESGERQSVLHRLVEEYSPKGVLVIPKCCGNMRGRSYDLFAPRVFPDIIWHLPCVSDLHDQPFTSGSPAVPRIIKDLLGAGIIIFQ